MVQVLIIQVVGQSPNHEGGYGRQVIPAVSLDGKLLTTITAEVLLCYSLASIRVDLLKTKIEPIPHPNLCPSVNGGGGGGGRDLLSSFHWNSFPRVVNATCSLPETIKQQREGKRGCVRFNCMFRIGSLMQKVGFEVDLKGRQNNFACATLRTPFRASQTQ